MGEELRGDLESFLRGELPEPPDVLVDGDMVPVARWTGSSLAAVRAVIHDGRGTPSDDIFLFSRRDGSLGRWDEINGSGGSEWFTTAEHWRELEPLPPEAVRWDGVLTVREGPVCAGAIGGRAGNAAFAVALTQRTRLVQPLESPLGLFVVAFDPHAAWEIDVLDQDDAVLAWLGKSAELSQ